MGIDVDAAFPEGDPLGVLIAKLFVCKYMLKMVLLNSSIERGYR